MSLFVVEQVLKYTDVNLLKTMQSGTVAPSTPGTGELWLDTSTNLFVIKRYNGATWDKVTLDRDLFGNGFIGGVRVLTTTDASYDSNSYNGQVIIDDNNSAIIVVEAGTGFSSCLMEMVGLNFPSYMYTELPNHTHTDTLALASGTVTIDTHSHSTVHNHGSFSATSHTHTSPNHTHIMGNHDHSYSAVTDNQNSSHTHNVSDTSSVPNVNHTHTYERLTGGTCGSLINQATLVSGNHNHDLVDDTAGQNSNHTHSISMNSDYASPTTTSGTILYSTSVGSSSGTQSSTTTGATAITGSVNTGLTGSILNAGINGGTLNDTLKTVLTPTTLEIQVTQDLTNWGTTYTSSAYPELLNLNTTEGTGDFDITSRINIGVNYIRLSMPTAKIGGSVAYHIRTS